MKTYFPIEGRNRWPASRSAETKHCVVVGNKTVCIGTWASPCYGFNSLISLYVSVCNKFCLCWLATRARSNELVHCQLAAQLQGEWCR